MKILKASIALLISIIFAAVVFLFVSQQMFDPKKAPKNYGKIDTQLFVKEETKQPLVVYFGGSEGGNSMAKQRNANERKYIPIVVMQCWLLATLALKAFPQN